MHKQCIVIERYYITRQGGPKTEGVKTEAHGDLMAQMSPETTSQ